MRLPMHWTLASTWKLHLRLNPFQTQMMEARRLISIRTYACYQRRNHLVLPARRSGRLLGYQYHRSGRPSGKGRDRGLLQPRVAKATDWRPPAGPGLQEDLSLSAPMPLAPPVLTATKSHQSLAAR